MSCNVIFIHSFYCTIVFTELPLEMLPLLFGLKEPKKNF